MINYESKSVIYSALLKNGHGSFKLDIIEYCNKADIIREQYYLDLLKPEYNILKVAWL